MEDERRKFLLGLLAAGGGAAVLPELVEAAAQTIKVEKPIAARFLKQEKIQTGDHTDLHAQFEEVGANGTKRVTSSVVTEYNGDPIRRRYISQHIQLFEHANDLKPVHTQILSGFVTVRQIDPNHADISVTSIDKNGVTVRNLGTVGTPANRRSGENMTPEEIVEEFYMPKARGEK
jgi:hypothetical protein